MKKIILILIMAIMLSKSYGQVVSPTHHNEIAGSYGILTSNQIINVFKDVFSVIFSFGNFDKQNIEYSGGWFLTYKYLPKNNFLINASVGLDMCKGDLIGDDQVKYGEFKTTYTSAIVGFDYRYLNQELIQLYSGLDLGVTLCRSSGTQSDSGITDSMWDGSYLNFQINLLGVRVGRSLAGFAELGYGYKGMINGGVSLQF